MFDYTVTEAGFGSDLGFEKFMDIVTREAKIPVDAVVIVATIRAMKHHGGAKNIDEENVPALKTGIENLFAHIKNIENFGIEPVVALNIHPVDTDKEIKATSEILDAKKIKYAVSNVYSQGGEGGIQLAEKVLESIRENKITYAYDLNDPIRAKIEKIARKVYGARGIEFSKEALMDIKRAENNGFGKFYVCMAKTQSSISDNPSLLNVPENFKVKVNSIVINGGSGFIIPILGNIMTMPGLPRHPAAEKIDIDSKGNITGLS